MRTSLRVFTAAVSTLLIAVALTVIPFTPRAGAINGIHTINLQSRSCAEGNGGTSVCAVTATLQGGVNFGPTISATIVAADDSARKGTDYQYTNQTVSWAGGESGDRTVNVTINGDTSPEPAETFTLSVTNPVQAAAGTPATVTITQDDGTPPTLQVTAPAPSAEGDANNIRTVKVKVNNPTNQPMSVNYNTSDGSATSDSSKGAIDYTPITTKVLNWSAGNGDEQTIDVTVRGDTISEPDERFFVNFGNANNIGISGGASATNIDLLNDDGNAASIPRLTLENIPDKTEGDTSTTTQTVTVTLSPAAGQTVSVDYATSDGTAVKTAGETKGDYTETKGTLVFPQGTTSKTFTVPIEGDPADEQDETYNVTLGNPINAQIGDPATKAAKIVNDDYGQITTGAGPGGGPHVRQFGATGSDLGGWFTFTTAPGTKPYTAGIHVGRGDFYRPTQDGMVIGGDGVDEIIVASGPTFSPRILIYATDGTLLNSFLAYDSNFFGGLYVAAGNLDGDTSNGDELVTGPGPGGGPHVKVFKVRGGGNNVEALSGFFAYPGGFSGGVRVAVGNVAGDAKDEIVTGAGPGGAPHVRVFDGAGAPNGGGFFAYDFNFRGGVFVGAANGRIATGPGAGGGPHVKVFDGNGAAQGPGFFAYDPNFSGGVFVGMGNLDNDLAAEIVTGPGAGGGPHVKVFSQNGSLPFGPGFFAYGPTFTGGVEIAVSVAGV